MWMQLQTAYDTLNDHERRRVYDLRWAGIRASLQTQQDPYWRHVEAAQIPKGKTAKKRARKQKGDRSRQGRPRMSDVTKSTCESQIAELNRLIREVEADLKRLRDHNDESSRKDRRGGRTAGGRS